MDELISEWNSGDAEAVNLALAVLALLSVLAAAAEPVIRALRGQPPGWARTGSNLVVGVVQQTLGVLLERPLWLAILGLAWTLTPLRIPLTPMSWVLVFVVGDLAYYLTHRLEHRVRLGWAHHSVHHSDEGFDLSTAQRIAWTEPLLAWYGLVPLVLIGFHPVQVLIVSQVLLLYQVWIHTTHVGRLGWMEGVLNTPSAHRVHHGSDPEYLDTNYGAVLMIWDRLFGTYAPEVASPRYGLTSPVRTLNPAAINAAPYVALADDLRRSRTFAEGVLSLLGPPEWSPETGFSTLRPGSTWARLVRWLRPMAPS